jgi:hypothetical protein
LAPYIQISSYGQWFQIQTIYTCLANQTACIYYEPGTPPAGSGLGGGLPLSSPGAGTTTTAPTATPNAAAPSAGSAPAAATSIGGVLKAVSGQVATTTSTTTPTGGSGS